MAVKKSKKLKAKEKANGVETPGAGHNFKVDRKAAKAFVDRLDRIHDQKAEDNAGHMADIRVIYEDAANDLGCSKKAFKAIYAEHRWLKANQAYLAGMKDDDRDQADKIRLALGQYASSPLGKAAVERAELTEASTEATVQ